MNKICKICGNKIKSHHQISFIGGKKVHKKCSKINKNKKDKSINFLMIKLNKGEKITL